MARNGTKAPAWLIEMADELMPRDELAQPVQPGKQERARLLAVDRRRRYRQRQRGEDVPLRRPGPQPKSSL
jgi:hypothetical protein